MARSYFALFSGVMPPQAFKAMTAPELLTISDVWEAARKSPPSLLFRVRSESEPGDNATVEDRLESCVGVVDAVTRWRAVFNMTRSMLAAIRHQQLRQACAGAMQFIATQHPANVTQEQRGGVIASILQCLEVDDKNPQGPSPFEVAIAYGVARIVGSDNDIEAAHYIPFVDALNPFNPDEQRQEYSARMGTVETMSGAVLLTEAANRLGERVPQWLAAPMPSLEIAGGDAAPDRERDRDD